MGITRTFSGQVESGRVQHLGHADTRADNILSLETGAKQQLNRLRFYESKMIPLRFNSDSRMQYTGVAQNKTSDFYFLEHLCILLVNFSNSHRYNQKR